MTLIAQATASLDPLVTLIGQGAIVGGMLYWLTQSLVPRLFDGAKADREAFVVALAKQSDAINDLAAAIRALAKHLNGTSAIAGVESGPFRKPEERPHGAKS